MKVLVNLGEETVKLAEPMKLDGMIHLTGNYPKADADEIRAQRAYECVAYLKK